MGYQDRHYNQDGGGGGAQMLFGMGVGRRSITFWLLVINISVFVLDGILFRAGVVVGIQTPYGVLPVGPLEGFGYFSAGTTIFGLQAWRLLTFQFLHGGIGHLLGNMIGLFFFGPMVEQYWGSKRFLAFYLLCGFSGVLGYLALWGSGLVVSQTWVPLVGASAGIFGILVSAAVIAPNTRVLFMLLFPIPLKVLIWVIIGIAAYTVVAQGNQPGANAGGEAAHLGGALLGFIFMKKAGLLNWADRLSPEAIRDGYNKGRHEKKVKKEQATRQEVDRILAKVSEKGLQSLTSREKKILQQDTDRLRDS
ncbi:MAG: rhomboid family intramembrane serine protease [Phycisphaeraceae bacterium]|nr:rhomboid family intramembrane serine protease [Phycisphaeraceae bacterium]